MIAVTVNHAKSKLALGMRSCLVALAVLLPAGCATPRAASRISDPAYQQELRRTAAATLGPETPYVAVTIPSGGHLADALFVAQSVIFGPSRTAASVARLLAEADASGRTLVIAGPNPVKVGRVLYDALRAVRPEQRPRILWLAPASSARLARRIERRCNVEIILAEPHQGL